MDDDRNGLFAPPDDLPRRLRGEAETLFLIALSPTVWAAHFLATYVTGAVWCARVAGRDGALDDARLAIGAYTALALALIAAVGFIGWRRHSYGGAAVPHDEATPEDRHRFLGFSTVLLSALSFVATVYVAMPALLLETCR